MGFERTKTIRFSVDQFSKTGNLHAVLNGN